MCVSSDIIGAESEHSLIKFIDNCAGTDLYESAYCGTGSLLTFRGDIKVPMYLVLQIMKDSCRVNTGSNNIY